MKTLWDKIGGRKFIITVILLISGAVIDIYTDRGLSTNYKELMIFLAAIYITGNGIGVVSDAIKKKVTTQNNSSKSNFKQIEDNVSNLLQYQDHILKTVQLNTQGLSEIVTKLSNKDSIK